MRRVYRKAEGRGVLFHTNIRSWYWLKGKRKEIGADFLYLTTREVVRIGNVWSAHELRGNFAWRIFAVVKQFPALRPMRRVSRCWLYSLRILPSPSFGNVTFPILNYCFLLYIYIYQETWERLDAKYLKKNFLRRREATEYIYSKISEVIFSVDNSGKRIVGLDF